MQEPESLCSKLPAHGIDPSDISAWPVEASDETRLDRIDGTVEDNRNCRGCGFGCECRIRGARGDDGDSAADQIGRQGRQSVIFIVRKAKFDGNVAALNVAGFVQPFAERGHKMGALIWRAVVEKPNHRHRRLLRARRERPSDCRAADERDELAPPHVLPQVKWHTLPHRRDRNCVVHHSKIDCRMTELGQ
jgi:hypothetical protein